MTRDMIVETLGAPTIGGGAPSPAAARPGAALAASPATGPISPGAGAGTPRVVGLDLSLTGTGVAYSDATTVLRVVGDLRDTGRLSYIRSAVLDHVEDADAELVVIEGPAYSRALGAGHHEAAGLWWLIKWSLDGLAHPVAVVPPSVLKKYATGRGNATKADMRMALFQRAGLDLRDDNKVDAWWLRAMGLDHLGHPLVQLPQAQRDVLAKVAWPERVGA